MKAREQFPFMMQQQWQLPILWKIHFDSGKANNLDWCMYFDTIYNRYVIVHAILDLEDFM